MAIKPSPDRSDLESKTREDLQTIAKVKGVDAPARATKAALIEAIMGESQVSPVPRGAANPPASRAVRSRRTVATPSDDFEDLLGEFVADMKL
ncbi:MAG: Rho termination factor N-terminal domain-containing protein, partial [Acidimicrobiales bacterium]